jgi:hypothetical protein
MSEWQTVLMGDLLITYHFSLFTFHSTNNGTFWNFVTSTSP